MPPLIKPAEMKFVNLPERKAILAGSTDVLVVGGGPAGLGAAYGAAKAGVNVLLAERYGFLGGNATAALVMPFSSYHTQNKSKPTKVLPLMPTDHGQGEPVIAGAVKVFVEKLVSAGGAIAPSSQTGFIVPFDPEIFKLTALDLIEQLNVNFLFHAFASGILTEDFNKAVIFETKSGPLVVNAKIIIDCTGDGDIAAMAGAAYEIGRETDGLVQPMSLLFRMAEFENEAFNNYIKEHPEQWRGVYGLWDLVKKAAESDNIKIPREDVLIFATSHENEVSLNCTRVSQVFGTDVWDLTYAEFQSRQQLKQIVQFFKKYVPGFEKAYNVQSGVHTGVRETRRIICEYQLNSQDVLTARKFNDTIARCSYPIDIHDPAGKKTLLKKLPPGEYYDIPLRCLIPKEIENLLVAGRCIGGTHEAHSSYRVMPTSMATGQAAGVCAALAVRHGCSPGKILFSLVQDELIRQGAILK